MTSRKRVLQVSYMCNPCTSMESRLGWHRAIVGASEFDTWIVCAEENRPHIEEYTSRAGATPGLTFCYVPSSPCDRNFSDAPGLSYRAYHNWHRRVFELAVELHRRESFDLTHQVGLCGYREPGYLWQLDLPFVWGPIGGTQNLPWRYLTTQGLRGAVYEVVRTLANQCHLRFRRRVRAAAKGARWVFAANSTAQRDFHRVFGVSTELQLETGIQEIPQYEREPRPQDAQLRILWSGRFRPWKALPLLLHALRGLDRKISFQLRIIGYEQGEEDCRHLAKRLGLEPNIEWLGWPSYAETFTHYRWADVFAFTSLRDTSGTGLLEALMHGCPIVGMNHQGAKDVMNSQCAVAIPVTSPRKTIGQFHDAFLMLARDPERLARLSRGACERARQFTWAKLGDRMLEVYRSILELDWPSETTPSPIFLETGNGTQG